MEHVYRCSYCGTFFPYADSCLDHEVICSRKTKTRTYRLAWESHNGVEHPVFYTEPVRYVSCPESFIDVATVEHDSDKGLLPTAELITNDVDVGNRTKYLRKMVDTLEQAIKADISGLKSGIVALQKVNIEQAWVEEIG